MLLTIILLKEIETNELFGINVKLLSHALILYFVPLMLLTFFSKFKNVIAC